MYFTCNGFYLLNQPPSLPFPTCFHFLNDDFILWLFLFGQLFFLVNFQNPPLSDIMRCVFFFFFELTLWVWLEILLCSVQFSHSVVSDSQTPWTEAHQASLSITSSRILLKLMSIEQWYHPTISSSVIPFSSCPQSFPASGSFPLSQFFMSGGQIIGVSTCMLL